MSESCPRCGAPRDNSARICPACRFDFGPARRLSGPVAPDPGREFFTDRYKGTPYESHSEPSRFNTTNVQRVQRQLLLLALGLIALLIGIVVAKLPGVTDRSIPNEVLIPVPLLVPLVAGTLSKVVPGRKARGLFKGWLLGHVGWSVGAVFAFLLGQVSIPTLPVDVGFVADQVVMAVAGTVVLRAILVLFE